MELGNTSFQARLTTSPRGERAPVEALVELCDDAAGGGVGNGKSGSGHVVPYAQRLFPLNVAVAGRHSIRVTAVAGSVV